MYNIIGVSRDTVNEPDDWDKDEFCNDIQGIKTVATSRAFLQRQDKLTFDPHHVIRACQKELGLERQASSRQT